MDFFRRIRKKQCEILKVESLERLYQHNINFYYIPPAKDVTVNWLEDVVTERLKVLHILERTSGKHAIGDGNTKWKERISSKFKLEKLFSYVRLIENDSNDKEALLIARERDYISHFILRFYYCDSDVLRQWFVERETELFRLKFSSLSSDEIQDFLKVNELDYTPLRYEEIKSEILEKADFVNYQNLAQNTQFYRVPFFEVLNLVSSRQCILQGGYAYANNLVDIFETIHKGYIEKGLQFTYRMMSVIKEDVRITDLLKTIHRLQPGNELIFSHQTPNIIDCIDNLSTKSFPLCARLCHELLRKKHHLKYFGRNQYQLFLKGIGVSLEDSLKFWIEEFTHNSKDKPLPGKYRYQIEFNYGRRGSKVDIQPPSCSDLIGMNYPNFQQCYGCPFKFMESSNLKTKLLDYGLTSIQIDDVLNYSNKSDYQLACSKYFEVVHGCHPNEVISNPIRYFELCKMLTEIRHKQTTTTCANNKSFNDSLYDKHLWEMLQPIEESIQQTETYLMSQLDYINY